MRTEHDKLVEDCARAISKHRTGLEAYWHGDIGAARAAIAIAVARCAAVAEARYMGDNNREDMEARRIAAAIRALLSPNDRGEK